MDVLRIIEHEHEEIRQSIAVLIDARPQGSPALVAELTDRLSQRISRHVEVEEEIFYPAAERASAELADMTREGCTAHRELVLLISRIASTELADPEIRDLTDGLSRALAQHVSGFLNVLRPAACDAMAKSLVQLGDRYGDVRRNVQEDGLLPQLLAFTLDADSCCIDIGSHGGTVLRDILRCAPRGNHIAYEPIPALAQELRRSFPTVDVRQAAVSDEDGEATFIHVTAAAAYSGLRERPSSASGWPDHITEDDLEKISVRTERLDSALPPGFEPTLIKVDVEGAENLVFSGAMDTLASHRPVVVFEHEGASPAYGDTSPQIWDLLVAQAGLRIYDYYGRGPYTREQFLRSATLLTNTNYLARP